MNEHGAICPQCGKHFAPSKHQLSLLRMGRRKHIFCSHACSVEFYRGKARWVKDDIPFFAACSYCGREFALSKRVRYLIRHTGQANVYCSRDCYNKSRLSYRHSEETRRKIALSRLGPKHPFYGKQQSEESNHKRSLALRGTRNHRWRHDAPVVQCAYCGQRMRKMPYEAKANKSGRFYCSTKCMGLHKALLEQGERNPNWQGGKSFEPYAPAFNERLKQYIRSRDGHTCQLCGATRNRVRGGYGAMTVHHIDYNKNNCDERNLITLCGRCNSRVNFSREYWQAHFESVMAERYGVVSD